jgi:hypothetical protein
MPRSESMPSKPRGAAAGRARVIATAVALVLGLLAGGAPAQEVLTNESVISMVKAGLSETIILAKVKSSAGKFDVRTDSLVALKRAGVTDRVIEAMVSHPGQAAAAAPAPAPAATAAPAGGAATAPGVGALPSQTATATGQAMAALKDRDVVYQLIGQRYLELQPQLIEIQTNHQFFTYKSEVVISGRKATYRTAEKQPVFYTPYSHTEALLVKLKQGDSHDDRNLKMGSGAFMPFGGTTRHGVRQEDRIDVASDRDGRGYYRITPKSPLPAGEYGFVIVGGAAVSTGKIFDFGID